MKKYSELWFLGFFLVISLLLLRIAYGQNENSEKLESFAHTWIDDKRSSLEGLSIAIDSNRDIYVTGNLRASFRAKGAKRKVILLKYNKDGMFLWAKSWGGSDNYDWANSIAIDENDDIFVAGVSQSFGAGQGDVLLLKYNREGNLLWSKTWGGPNIDRAHAVALDSNGNIYVAGSTGSFGAGKNDILLLKFNTEGAVIWSKTWGGKGFEHAYALALDPEGNVYLTGDTESFATSPLPLNLAEETVARDIILQKYNKDGKLLWSKTWGERRRDEGKAITIDSNGNIYVAGYTKRYKIEKKGGKDSYILYDQHIILLKYGKNSNLLWNKTWVKSEKDWAYAASVSVDKAGNTYVLGRARQLLKFDQNGELLWNKNWTNQSAWTNAIALDISESILIVGKADTYRVDFTKCAWEEINGILGKVVGKKSSPRGTIFSPEGKISSPPGIEENLLGKIDDPSSNDTGVFVSRFVQR